LFFHHLTFNISNLPLVASAAALLALSIYHFLKKNPVSTAFGWLCAAFFGWIAGLAWSGFCQSPTESFGNRLHFLVVAFIPPIFNLATHRFVDTQLGKALWDFRLLAVVSAAVGGLAIFHPGFVAQSQTTAVGITRHFGWPGWVLIGYLALASLYNCWLWVLAGLREKDPVHRRRIRIMTAGFLLMGFAFVDFLRDVGVPLYPVGAAWLTLLMLFESYVLYVYDISRIQSFLSALGFSLLTFAILAVPWSLAFMGLGSRFRHLGTPSLFLIHLAMLALTIPYIYFGIPWLRHLVSKKESGYQRIINDFLGQVYYLKNPNKLVQHLNAMIQKTTALPARIIMKNVGPQHFYLWKNDYSHEPLPQAVLGFLPWLEQNPEILLKYDVMKNPEMSAVRATLAQVFEALGAQMLVPLVQNDALLGVLCIGEKADGEPPNALEMEFFRRLQSIASLALNNSYLYDHIRQLSRDLWDVNVTLNEKVKEKTLALENALAFMKKMNEEQREFFTMASHNLKTPLTSIKISSSLLWKETGDPKNDSVYAILQSNLKRLEALVSDIIEIVRAEYGRLELRPSQVDIHQLTREIQKELGWIYSDKAIEWSFAIPAEITRIWADADRLKTVFLNLFSNAYKFTPPHGRVHLSLKAAEPSDLEKYEGLEKSEGQAFYEFCIQDSGDGIPEEEQKALFQIFKQVSRSHKRYQGNGLGLYLVKKIIQNHGGAITLSSRWGEGSVFSFVLPLGRTEA